MTSGRAMTGARLIVLEPFGATGCFSSRPPQEAMMKNPALMPLIAAALMVSATSSFAQNNTPPANSVENPANTPQHGTGTGTAPENMGATGWTGGSRGQTKDPATTTGQANSDRDAEAAKDQPAMATGEDLKGPPKQFPPDKTPE
jgi:hypothetical protein